ncbi:hypothetical protein ACFY8O_04855 [Streptomyces argenteolus]|uniref:YhgA-like transposase n=1 Tax=Streptomyces argenteolus TaxID=67274 RepID=A0ABW6WZK7_9ACTN
MIRSWHAAMRRVLQDDPAVFARTLRTLGIPFTDPVTTALLPTGLTQADHVPSGLRTPDPVGPPGFEILLRVAPAEGDGYVLVLETAGTRSPARRSYWRSRLAHLLAAYRMPPVLLIVCPDEVTARWAERPLVLGPPHWAALTFHPLVLGPHNVPAVADPTQAARDIPLAALSAMTHGTGPEAEAVLASLAEALRGAGGAEEKDLATVFGELTALGLGTGTAARAWQGMAPTGTSPCRAKSLGGHCADTRAEDWARSVLTVLERRGIAVTDELRDRVCGCIDMALLGRWTVRALSATTADDLFTDA